MFWLLLLILAFKSGWKQFWSDCNVPRHCKLTCTSNKTLVYGQNLEFILQTQLEFILQSSTKLAFLSCLAVPVSRTTICNAVQNLAWSYLIEYTCIFSIWKILWIFLESTYRPIYTNFGLFTNLMQSTVVTQWIPKELTMNCCKCIRKLYFTVGPLIALCS